MSRNLRIIHCLRAPLGGLFRHVFDLAVEQARVGHEVVVIYDHSTLTPSVKPQIARLHEVCLLGVQSTKMPRLLSFSDYTAYRAVKTFAKDSQAQIIHGHGAKGGAYARLAARSLHNRMSPCLGFYTPHGGSLHYSPTSISGRLFLGLERKLARMSSGLIFESAYSARIFSEVVGAGYCPVNIIPNGVSEEEFVPVELAEGAADFLFVGELRQLKGVDIFLTALSLLKDQFPAASAVIVGDGPDSQRFIKMSETLGLSKQVVFPGRLPARQAFTLGRAMVVPSRAESFPYIVLEAGAAQKPLISTDVGGINEIVEGSDTQLIEPENPLALKNAMAEFLSDPARQALKAQRLQALILKRFNIETMAAQVTDFYLSVLKR